MYRWCALAYLTALWACMPLALCTAMFSATKPLPPVTKGKRVVIVTGAHMSKAVQMMRHMRRAGHPVVCVDFPEWRLAAGRFSRCTTRFHTVPKQGSAYVHAILTLVHRYDACLVVPVAQPHHSAHDSRLKHLLPRSCRTLAVDAELHDILDDKHSFAELCHLLGLPSPSTHRVTSMPQLCRLNRQLAPRPFILKRLRHDAARRRCITLPRPPAELVSDDALRTLSPSDAWVAQDAMVRPEYSSYTLAVRGRVVAHTDSCAASLTNRFAHVGHAGIRSWVQHFCERTKLDGQVCFDFMTGLDGVVRPIECNPRCSAVVANMRGQPDFHEAVLNPDLDACVVPPRGTPCDNWICRLYGAVAAGSVAALMQALRCEDAYLDGSDWLPFLFLYGVQVPVQLTHRVYDGRRWSGVNWNVGKILVAT